MKEPRLLLLLIVLVLVIIQRECSRRDLVKQQDFNLEALTDSVSVTKNKLGEVSYKVTALRSTNADLLKSISSKDTTIQRLQELVDIYKSEVSDGGTITVTETITVIDTVTEIVYLDSTSSFNFTDKWISLSGSIEDQLLKFKLATKDQLSIITGYEREGFLKLKRKPFAEITPASPYTKVVDIKSITIQNDNRYNWLSVTGGPSIIYVNGQVFAGLGFTIGPSYSIY